MALPAIGRGERTFQDLGEVIAALWPTSIGDRSKMVLERPLEIVNASDVTLGNVATAQSPFAAANDTIAVEASTLYAWEFGYHLVTGATTHTTGVGLTLVTATLAGIRGWGVGYSGADDTLAAPQMKPIIQAASTLLTATSTAVNTYLQGKGRLRTTLAGTISPFIIFSADPTGTCLSKRENYFRLTKLGASDAVAIGGGTFS